jgi:hypothetical protein
MRPDHPLLAAKGRLIVHLLFCPNRSLLRLSTVIGNWPTPEASTIRSGQSGRFSTPSSQAPALCYAEADHLPCPAIR